MATSQRPWRTRGGLVTIGVVLSLMTGLGLTVLGLGAADQAVASFDAASWVWSRGKGEIARVNGVTARVDTRVDVPSGRNHAMQVSQNDRFVILRDVDTGLISSMDLASLKIFRAPPSLSGMGVRVALSNDAAFVIDAVQGVIRQLDPRTLQPIGQPLRYPPGITGGVFDGTGKLWVAVPGEGTVSAITPAAVPSDSPDGDGNDGGQAASAGPAMSRTVPVTEASHDLAISALDDGVAVLDRTNNVLSTVRAAVQKTTLPLAGPGAVAPQTDGLSVPVTVPDARRVYVANGDKMTGEFAVPGDGPELQPAVAWEGFFYVAESTTGKVHVFDGQGREQTAIDVPSPGGELELEVRENYLFINAPGSSTARVVDNAHQVRVVDKYADDVLGGDKPPVPDNPPPPPPPKEPEVSVPDEPRNVRAAAGDAEARVSWQAADPNGAEITRYVVSGAGRTFQVGADQRSVNVTGLTNGETYTFEVYAVNREGEGPPRESNEVMPTSEVPDAPTAAKAEARPDGTVSVTWPAANGQGLDIKRYAVSAISEGGTAPVGDADGTELVIKGGELEYGKQYAFTVVAINERGAGSKASPVSNSVVPFAKPQKPEDVDAATVGDQAGTVKVIWTAPESNGRAITKYVVKAGDKQQDVSTGTAATIGGFGAGQTVQVEVRAVNEAGPSDPATATARTVAAPVVTITGGSSTFNTATVTFSVNQGGGTTACTVTASGGGGSAKGSCSSLKVSKLKPSTKYRFTVSARNAAATVTKTRDLSTRALLGTATCINGKSGAQRTYCDKDRTGRNGNEIFSVPDQNDAKKVGWAKPGTRLTAYCKRLNGDDVDSFVYNKNKRSTTWIQVNYKGRNYIPWAWLNLDGGDKLDNLPKC